MSNKEIIKKLINHFDLNKESYIRFLQNLEKPFVDDLFVPFLNEDLRIEKKIALDDYELRENFDAGWEFFKEEIIWVLLDQKIITEDFAKKITYKEFSENKILIDKSFVKLYRYILKETENINIGQLYYIKKLFDSADTKRLPRKDIYLVISFNFIDWFLSATEENWTSCLNLESSYEGAFWNGLAGLIIDKNRALLYLTDKKEKKYLGLTADRIITRTWLLLDKQNKLNLIRNYPNDMFAKKNISKIFNEFKFSMIENNFESKYDLDLLFSKKNMSVYIFQDFTTFSKEGNKFRLISGNSGNYFYNKKTKKIDVGKIHFFNEGFTSLFKKNKNLSSYSEIESDACTICGAPVEEGLQFYSPEGILLCSDCFHENYFICEGNGNTYSSAEHLIIHNDCFYSIEYYNENIAKLTEEEN